MISLLLLLLFQSYKQNFDPSREGIYHNQLSLCLFAFEHMVKVPLLVFTWISAIFLLSCGSQQLIFRIVF